MARISGRLFISIDGKPRELPCRITLPKLEEEPMTHVRLECPGCGHIITLDNSSIGSVEGAETLMGLALSRGWRPINGGPTQLVCSDTCQQAMIARYKIKPVAR